MEDTFYVYDGDTNYCSGGSVWFSCDGATYSRYDCAEPGEGYAVESNVSDPDDSGGTDATETGDECTEVTFSGMDNQGPCGSTDASGETIVTYPPSGSDESSTSGG